MAAMQLCKYYADVFHWECVKESGRLNNINLDFVTSTVTGRTFFDRSQSCKLAIEQMFLNF